MKLLGSLVLLTTSVLPHVYSKILDFRTDFGGIPFDESHEACNFNTRLFTTVLAENASENVIIIPESYIFHLHHGVYAEHVNNTVIQIDGTLRFERPSESDDTEHHLVSSCILIARSDNVTITSSGRGLIDGRGPRWWGVPMIGYVQVGERRPRLLRFNESSNLLIENIILQDSPYHTLYLQGVNDVEVRHISIIARRTHADGHGWVDLSAFNTDGIDVSGNNIHVHDVDIWVQDDCIAVKDNPFRGHRSTNMVFERINATGTGFTIGSILGSYVSNITFRDSYLHRPVKGIYLKFAKPNWFWTSRNLTARIEQIRYENITMEGPLQWPIWVGPAQQADNKNPCHPNPCSLCWPMSPAAKCNIVDKSKYVNLSLANVRINNPKISPGIILAKTGNEIEGVHFHDVVVSRGRLVPMARHKREITFPGTKQPIHDPYVPSNEESIGDSYLKTFSWFFPFEWLHLLARKGTLTLRKFHPFHKPKWQKWNRYYSCEGVINGTVSGKTWPVPECFERRGPAPRTGSVYSARYTSLVAAGLSFFLFLILTKRKRNW